MRVLEKSWIFVSKRVETLDYKVTDADLIGCQWIRQVQQVIRHQHFPVHLHCHIHQFYLVCVGLLFIAAVYSNVTVSAITLQYCQTADERHGNPAAR